MTRGAAIQPYLLLLVFLGPLLLAAGAYYGGWMRTTAPHGELLAAPVPMPDLAMTTPTGGKTSPDWLRGHWSLIYRPAERCATECVERLNRLNQVRLALGEDMGRAQVVLMHTDAAPALPAAADVTVARLDDTAGRPMAEFLEGSAPAAHRVLVADPVGRLVMTYPEDVEQRGILSDLERLMAIQ